MRIKLMRNIDYWFGIPLCALLSVGQYILLPLRLLIKRKHPPQRVAIIKLSELGAIILAYPLLAQLKKSSPSRSIFFCTFARNKELLDLLSDILPSENCFFIRESSLPLFIYDTARAIIEMRRRSLDAVIDLEFFSRFSAILAGLSGAKSRIGFYRYTFEGLYRGNFWTHKMQYNPLQHVSISYRAFATVLEADNKTTPQISENFTEQGSDIPVYRSDPRIKSELLGILPVALPLSNGRLFLINPGEGVLPLREWPLENFIVLAQRILSDAENYLIIVGTEGATRKADIFCAAVNCQRCFNLAGKTSLAQLMELFLLSQCLVTNDCGLAHLAMLTPLAKVVIFGPESPQIFAPRDGRTRVIYSAWPCSPCLSALNHRDSRCADNLCLKAISAEQVYRAIREGNSANLAL
jgi:ADP-heptose:LPS heptosyltransferase